MYTYFISFNPINRISLVNAVNVNATKVLSAVSYMAWKCSFYLSQRLSYCTFEAGYLEKNVPDSRLISVSTETIIVRDHSTEFFSRNVDSRDDNKPINNAVESAQVRLNEKDSSRKVRVF